ncbi:unnamed protein product [Rodentolepis nana]|uniref:Uncharacterized protein n=1 Tax=Rodentolepis nana TaxID=102285 RepID=A0A3P7RZS4_RODNA|nr:unnamed protein product [Rodentolepis nana]
MEANSRHPYPIYTILTAVTSVLATFMCRLPKEGHGEEMGNHEGGPRSMEAVDETIRKYEHCLKMILFTNNIDLFNVTKRPAIPQLVLWNPALNQYLDQIRKYEKTHERMEIMRKLANRDGDSNV